ncbi:hypothetical protein [Tuwongella immobilis]|uniref:Lipoprotein n=1 Tax=Tuwongella immobilis TaxID=692036 RepID=A0A6C2YJQ0_9BACT|nr:hypothetical protein [Tuwongella immobilis]VIP01511.1 unnamed protein product [Tuwongella immobilis]VTR98625.1 unnamed protein product [Tuwongella immobilis]
MRKWMFAGGWLACAAALLGCGTTNKRVMEPTVVEEFQVAPADGERWNKPTEYPEMKQSKLKDGGPQLPNSSGVGGPQFNRPGGR